MCAHVGGIFDILPSGLAPRLLAAEHSGPITALAATEGRAYWVAEGEAEGLVLQRVALPELESSPARYLVNARRQQEAGSSLPPGPRPLVAAARGGCRRDLPIVSGAGPTIVSGCMKGTYLPLGRFPLAHTRSLEEALSIQASFNASPMRADRIDRRAPFEWRANGIVCGALGIAVGQYRGGVHGHVENLLERYSLSIPLEGAGFGKQNDQYAPLIARRKAVLGSPSMPAEIRLESGYRGVQVAIPVPSLESTLDALTGVSRKEPLLFDASVDVDAPAAAGLMRLLDFVLAEADRDGSVLNTPLIQAQLSEVFVCAMLVGLQHNHSQLLRSKAAQVAPAHLRRAEEYIAANVDRAIGVSDLALVAGVSARALFAAFREHRGCSPMAFLRARRFELARTRLLTSSAMTVAEVALSCGFEHLGRFSVGYRQRFGESPKQTLQRAAIARVPRATLQKVDSASSRSG